MVGIVAILHYFVSYVRSVRFKIIEKYVNFYILVTLASFYGYSNDRRHSDSCYSLHLF